MTCLPHRPLCTLAHTVLRCGHLLLCVFPPPSPHPTELEALRLPGVERVRGVQWLQYSRVMPSSSYVGESYVALCILSTRDLGRYEVLDTVEFDTVFVRQAAVEGDFGMGGRTPF
jgi:hypothetical protein